jgi:hypothetical protein
MTAMHAGRLLVVHDDDRKTKYEDVRYRPGKDGQLTVYTAAGEVQHRDVHLTLVDA